MTNMLFGNLDFETKLVSICIFFIKVLDKKMVICPKGTKISSRKLKIVRYEITGQLLLSETANAEGTNISNYNTGDTIDSL